MITKQKISVNIDKQVLEDFKILVKVKSINMSAWVQHQMESFIKEERENVKATS